ncbi:MAG: RidA family protein [Tabrizicola sp.]|nr:RidA family protein [Tabrizicola sp.]
MTTTEKLAALGLSLPPPATPPGAFVGAIRHGSLITVSGQVPLKDGKVLMTGHLGAVIDGASRLLVEVFGDRGAHARCAIGVASLPRGAPVEIELSAVLGEA